MSLIITEFASTSGTPGKILAAQTVAIGSASAASAALNDATRLVRLFAEEDCSVAVGVSADAEADPTVALAANSDLLLEVHANSGFVVAVVDRLTVSGGGTVEAEGVTAVERAYGPYRQTILTCEDVEVALLDEAGVGQHGSAHVYTFPEGAIAFMGAVLDGSLTGPASFIDTFSGDFAIGTTAVVDHTTGLTATTENIANDAAMGPAVAKVAAMAKIHSNPADNADGSTTPAEAHLNVLIDDNAAHAAGTGLFTGTITLTWLFLGDTAP